jgi:hypothetical protein
VKIVVTVLMAGLAGSSAFLSGDLVVETGAIASVRSL